MCFKEIKQNELNENVFSMIGKKWMLVTAGDEKGVNAMTASWGGMGVMWGKPVVFVFIRPQRYTKEFIDRNERMSLTFYGEEYRKMLNYMGTVSGRDENKIEKMGLTTEFSDGTPYFKEADTVLLVRKMYAQELKKDCALDTDICKKWYPNEDYHTMYVCEIEKVLVK